MPKKTRRKTAPQNRVKKLMHTLKMQQALLSQYKKLKHSPKTATALTLGVASAALILYKFLK